jgi:polysaccharide export outer membrane protein
MIKMRVLEWICAACLSLAMGEACLPASAQGSEKDAEKGGLADRKIAPGDVLNIYVVGERDLPMEFPVSSSGTIIFPFLGTVELSGKTPTEAADMLKQSLGQDYYVDPQVFVSVKAYRKQYVRIIGQVFKPGLIELPSEQKFDIVDAIAAAQGLTNLADKDKITLTRKGKSQKLSLTKLKEITDPSKRVWVESDDIIEVGQSIF